MLRGIVGSVFPKESRCGDVRLQTSTAAAVAGAAIDADGVVADGACEAVMAAEEIAAGDNAASNARAHGDGDEISLSDKHTMFARYTAEKHANTNPDYFGTGASSGRTIADTFHNFVFGDD